MSQAEDNENDHVICIHASIQADAQPSPWSIPVPCAGHRTPRLDQRQKERSVLLTGQQQGFKKYHNKKMYLTDHNKTINCCNILDNRLAMSFEFTDAQNTDYLDRLCSRPSLLR